MQRINSYDSGQRPLTNVQYSQAPYQDNFYNTSNQYLPARGPPPKRGVSKWIKIGMPVIIIVIAAAVVAAVIAVKKHNDNAAASSNGGSGSGSGSGSSGGGSIGTGPGGPEQTISGSTSGFFPVATDTFFLPVYPSTTNDALFAEPTFSASPSAAWPAETFQPASPDPTSVRPDRPRLIAPSYKWQALPTLIQQDPYLAAFHKQILVNATTYNSLPVVARVVDGSSGILDVSRQVKERIKAWSYAYRMTNDTKWVDAAWRELQHAAGNATGGFGPPGDLWNSGHFLDVAEMTAAFAYAYDWLNDIWTPDQKTAILWSIINAGLQPGMTQYTTSAGWWTGSNGQVISGNWNCVCNGGMIMGALAIMNDDPTGTAAQIMAAAIPNAKKNCVFGPSSDGTWTETPNYWYFGTTGFAEMTSSLITATGSDYDISTTNPNFNLTGLYHMHVFGMTSLFDSGDHGPNKYSTTANSMMFFASQFNNPRYMLHQRDHFDAPEPNSMFWYDPSVAGAWWNGLPLDHYFNDPETAWAAMRSSWTDNTMAYIAMKSTKLQGHQTHQDLDCGDFVMDAMGQRWFGELGSGNYLSDDYFTSEADNATRWLYYRKRTEGQNTVLINAANQLAAEAAPTTNFDTTGEAQGSDTIFTVPSSSTAFFTTDMSTAYGGGTSIQRGIRFFNGRKQVLLQDDINTPSSIMWRAHTNATVTLGSGPTATLNLHGKSLTATIVSPANAAFTTMPAVRLSSDPATPSDTASQDQPNPGVTVLAIELEAGQTSIQVVFNPQWVGMSASDFVTPPNVPIANWNLRSHDAS